MSSPTQLSGSPFRSTKAMLLISLWVTASTILISHFRFYYQVNWHNAVKWGLGDGLLWAVLIGLFLVGFHKHHRVLSTRRGIVAVFSIAVVSGVFLHPFLSTLFFWAIDGSISRPFVDDVLHLVMKRFPQGILIGLVLGFIGLTIHRLKVQQAYTPLPLPRKTQNPTHITIKDSHGIHRIDVHDILYLEAAGNYVAIHTKNGEALHRTSLQALEGLLDPAQFYRLGRKHIVNIDFIQSLQRTKPKSAIVILNTNTELPVSQKYRKIIEQALTGSRD